MVEGPARGFDGKPLRVEMTKCSGCGDALCTQANIEKIAGRQMTADQWCRFVKMWKKTLTIREIVDTVIDESEREKQQNAKSNP